MVHWGRFPAFRYVRNELKKPHLTMKDADRGAVFMRWKERFLVPDHRVQDISGASFAGEPDMPLPVLSLRTSAGLHADANQIPFAYRLLLRLRGL